MDIREVTELKVAGTVENTGETPRIVLEDKSAERQVEVLGKVLEAQYRVGDDFLVLVTEGNPYEEALYIYYFNKHLELLDSLELSAMYGAGVLGNISTANRNEVCFSFFDSDERWALRVYPAPRYTVFGNRHPVKRTFSVFHKSWLSLKKI